MINTSLNTYYTLGRSRWVLAQGENVIPIPGTKRRSYLEENFIATELTLNADELAQINQVALQRIVVGASRAK